MNDQVLPVTPYSPANEEEAARVHCVNEVVNDEGTGVVCVPMYLEDIGFAERRKAAAAVAEVLLKKIIKGTATEIEILRFNALQNL